MRKLNKDEYPRGVPDAKAFAMINDLSPEALCSLICMSPLLQARFRQLVCDDYRDGKVQAVYIIEAWESDDE